MIDRDHPAVEAALSCNEACTLRIDLKPRVDRERRLSHILARMLTAALPHLTADDLRDTPAGRALMAEAWRRGYRDRQNDYGAADVTPCPYQEAIR